MKKFILAVLMITLGTPCFAEQNIELREGADYLYFSEVKIESIKSTNPHILSAQRISTYSGNDGQIIFTAKRSGKTDLAIQTEKGLISYNVEIKNEDVKASKSFLELDIPVSKVK